MSIYVDFHVLQTVPPSCVNRDDTGSPKTAVYGGEVRARVSSQSWKHAMRKDFGELFDENKLGSRTKYVFKMVEDELVKIDNTISEKDREKKITEALKNAGISLSSKKGDEKKADALFFMSKMQAEKLAELIAEGESDKNKYLNAVKENPAVDIALFGRMVASEPKLNCDACAQVAHAISTHAVENEYDYFTAVDDLQEADNAGAGHLGTVEFNSSTMYRYANVNVTELAGTLGTESAADVVKKFAQVFIKTMPTGKENTFANRTLPDAVYITVRNDQPINLCGAFERAVKRSDCGYAEVSEARLAEYAKKMYENYAAEPVKSFCIGEKLSEIADKYNMTDMLDQLEKAVNDILSEV